VIQAALFEDLYREINNLPSRIGKVGVRDPEYPCDAFDGQHYNGRGDCLSDGHYLCVECSKLSPDAYRFTDTIPRNAGRADRLLLFWRRPK
jgi:hypothetical protein